MVAKVKGSRQAISCFPRPSGYIMHWRSKELGGNKPETGG